MLSYSQPYFATPKLVDTILQELRIRLHTLNLTWLQYVIHRVERFEDNNGIEWGFFKLNHNNDREQILAPANDLKSLMYFEVNDTDLSVYKGELSRYNISLVCWLNKSKLSTANEDITNYYKDIIYKQLIRYFRVDNIQDEANRRDVINFAGLQTNEYKLMMGKYTGFKLTFDIYSDAETCYNITDMAQSLTLTDEVAFTSANIVDGVATLTHVLNSTKIIDVTVKAPSGEIMQLLAEPKALTLSTVEFGISVGTGTYTAYITAKPMLI
jgi:hypothetical protein